MSDPLTRSLSRALDGLGLFEEITGGASAHVSGLMGPARSLVVAAIAARTSGPVLAIVPDERRLAPAVSDLSTFLRALGDDRPVLPFPAFALDPYRGLSPHLEVTAARLDALVALLERRRVVVVATATACLYRTASPRILAERLVTLRPGDTIEPGELERQLVESGYRFEDPVTTPGEFARRGGILDVFPPWPPEGAEALRLELLGDELEEIRVFDPASQRAVRSASEARLVPASEWPFGPHEAARLGDVEDLAHRQAVGFILPRLAEYRASVFDYLGDGLLLAEEPALIARAAEGEWERVLSSHEGAEEDVYAEPRELLVDLEELGEIIRDGAVSLCEMALADEETHHVSSQILPSFRGRVGDFLAEVRKRLDRGEHVRVFVSAEGLTERVVELFADAGISAGRELEGNGSGPRARHVVLDHGALSQSFVVPELELAVFTAGDVFAEPPKPARRRGARIGSFLSDFRDLKIGDYVVHTEHGVGVFTGLEKLEEESATELVVLEYSGGDKLYVPVDRLDLLEKYSSAEAKRPRVDKLGGTGWERVKKRVKKSMRDMAGELLKLYAQRKAARGHAFSPDTAWMREFEALFEFEETPDQLQAIEDVKRDMEASFPMDRLICGDVGYGKTEVAMRAAFKAISDGKQVAVLVPTTVLAFQHLSTFRGRFAPFPVRVEMMSRFVARAEQKQILADLAAGKVDIVIGTHRLLSKDVSFSDLGLLVVDEEQRFGVAHKERLKKLRAGVDALAMSATPIPRTLHMSLSGIRDLSVIETPPRDRMAIQTHIVRLEPKVLAEAIRYELGRGGQVYFVHNRVGSIYSMANYLLRLVPEARIGVAHGQMKERELEKIMLRFIRQEIDALVSTTIIENGLDIPLVNTLVVNRADRYGLSQLYQLRGRVGRSNRRAYAYLLVPEESHLTPLARRRLAAIREFSELGAGFRIAALDLELRGAGNLLGGEQHGHIEAVGFDLYCRLLDETVQELESGEAARPVRASLNLKVELRIPERYVPDSNQRMSIYKRASGARDREELGKIVEETRDRYGPLPEPVLQFFDYSRLALVARELGVDAIDRERGRLALRISEGSGLDPERLVGFAGRFPGTTFAPEGEAVILRVPLEGVEPMEVLTGVREVLHRLGPYVKRA